MGDKLKRMTDWQDMIIGDRMTVDREFSSRVENSQFSRQEWGLIMTSVTFEIENPDDEAAAKIVADTTKLPGMMPEIEKVSEMDPMAGPHDGSKSGGGLLDSLLGALGLGGGNDDIDESRVDAAETLVTAYAEELQTHLEAEGRWDEVRTAAAEDPE